MKSKLWKWLVFLRKMMVSSFSPKVWNIGFIGFICFLLTFSSILVFSWLVLIGLIGFLFSFQMHAYGAHSKSVLWHLIGQALGGTFGVHGLQNCFHSTSAGTFGVHGLLNPLQSTPPHELLRNWRFYKGKVDILKRKLHQYFLFFSGMEYVCSK